MNTTVVKPSGEERERIREILKKNKNNNSTIGWLASAFLSGKNIVSLKLNT